MPTYEYSCPLCKQPIIVAASINDQVTAPTCLNCQIPTIRQYNTTPIHFKGDGWAGKK